MKIQKFRRRRSGENRELWEFLKMENLALEMEGEKIPEISTRKEWERKEHSQDHPSRNSLLKFFLLCLLASLITTSITILVLSLLVVDSAAKFQKNPEIPQIPQIPENPVDPKFQFLHRLSQSKVFSYPGGEIQWSRFRSNPEEYQSAEELEFGRSLNSRKSQISFGTLRIRSQGLRAPHWHFNANEHGFLLQGSAWIGILSPDSSHLTSFNVSRGQVVFFPRNFPHWIKNVGNEDLLFLLFFSTHHELQTLDLDDAFFGIPQDVAARALKPQGGIDFIRTFQKQPEDQAVNLPENLPQLVRNSTYFQSKDEEVWKFFFDLKGSQEFPFPGGIFQWARFRKNTTGLTENQRIFSEFLNQHQDTLTLATLRIFGNSQGQPHFHFNANEMGFVARGCGQVGVTLPTSNSQFSIGLGDVIFFPMGTQHHIRSLCEEDLLLVLAYSTGEELETLRMNQYFPGTSDHILAQLFHKKQEEFQKFPKPSD